MKLVEATRCPISGDVGDVAIEAVSDAFFATPGLWRYRKDGRTGHLWLDPRPADEDIGALYSNYYTHESATAGAVRSTWQQALSFALARRLGYPIGGVVSKVAKFISYLPSVADAAELEMMRVPAMQSGTFLDVGCGGGGLLRRMHAAGWNVVGTEPDPNAAARLRSQLGFPVFADVKDLFAQAQRFDLIALSHVIEHVADPVSLLKELAALLKTGGRLIVTTPNGGSLGARVFGRDWRGLEPPRHFNVFTVPSMREAFAKSGFRILQISTHARLARGIFYVSALAKAGHREIECRRSRQNRLLTIAGYGFQVLEAAAVRIAPSTGEEIFCVASGPHAPSQDGQ